MRQFSTYKNTYEIFTIRADESASPSDNSRSPFANFMVRLHDSSYKKCEILSSEANEVCKYQLRSKLSNITLTFGIQFTPEYPDISCTKQ